MTSIAPGLKAFFLRFGNTECRIKGDGEKGFAGIRNRLVDNANISVKDSAIVKEICRNPMYQRNVKFFLKDDSRGTHLTNSYCIVDSVIRVMRNLTGKDFSNRNTFFKTVEIYNNTVHSAFANRFTPAQVQSDPELEMFFVNRNEEKLKSVIGRQSVEGLKNFKVDDILLVHIPFEKTKGKFAKQRRNFSALARFDRYEGGNAVVTLLKTIPNLKNTLVIPLFYCKKIADSFDTVAQKYKTLL
jgi:hypothetical protein